MSTRPMRRFLSIEAVETLESKAVWLERPWVGRDQRARLAASSILAVPLLGADGQPYWPKGATSGVEGLRRALDPAFTIEVAYDPALEVEVPSHAWRFPGLVFASQSFKAFRDFRRVVTENLDAVFPGHKQTDRFEATFIVEARNQRWLSFSYGGGPKGMAQALEGTLPHFLLALEHEPVPAAA